jgi:hypothetical protein
MGEMGGRSFSAVIFLVLFLSGGRLSVGGGGEPGNHCADVYRVDRVLSSPRVCSPSLLMVELRVSVVAVLLLRQIRHLQADVVFDEAAARFFCLLFFGSGSGAGDGYAVISSISGGGGRNLPAFLRKGGILRRLPHWRP